MVDAAATDLLLDATQGDAAALRRVLPAVYRELRRLAAAHLRRERPGHTLAATALVHEAYLRLFDQSRVDWHNRAQFLALAATMMRRILVNYARSRTADKRGGHGAERVSLTIADGERGPPVDLLALHGALGRLAEHDPRKAKVVELKFFAGLTTEEVAQVLSISVPTVERDWGFARAWLFHQLGEVR